MSSLACFQGSPLVAVYGATKSFLLSIAEALADGHDAKGPTPLSKEPVEVARAAIRGLGRKRIVIPGAMIGRTTRAIYGERSS